MMGERGDLEGSGEGGRSESGRGESESESSQASIGTMGQGGGGGDAGGALASGITARRQDRQILHSCIPGSLAKVQALHQRHIARD